MEQRGIASAYPKHDGWLFGATEAETNAVRDVFQTEAEQVTGRCFPVILKAIC